MSSDRQKKSPSLKRMKGRARVGAGSVSHTAQLEQIARDAGFADFYSALQVKGRAPVTTAPHRLPGAKDCLGPIFTKEIGDAWWSLEIGPQGPELWNRRFGQFRADRISQLGIFQVLVPPDRSKGDQWWQVSRYGTYHSATLEGWADADAYRLAEQFGVLVQSTRWRSPQSVLSEICFLQSPAFAALRKSIRSGATQLPNPDVWSYGLCFVWEWLVAMSDAHFEEVGRSSVDCLLRSWPPGAWVRHLQKLVRGHWTQLQNDRAGFEAEVARLFPAWLANARSISSKSATKKLLKLVETSPSI